MKYMYSYHCATWYTNEWMTIINLNIQQCQNGKKLRWNIQLLKVDFQDT